VNHLSFADRYFTKFSRSRRTTTRYLRQTHEYSPHNSINGHNNITPPRHEHLKHRGRPSYWDAQCARECAHRHGGPTRRACWREIPATCARHDTFQFVTLMLLDLSRAFAQSRFAGASPPISSTKPRSLAARPLQITPLCDRLGLLGTEMPPLRNFGGERRIQMPDRFHSSARVRLQSARAQSTSHRLIGAGLHIFQIDAKLMHQAAEIEPSHRPRR